MGATKKQPEAVNSRGYWQEQISKAQKRFTDFHSGGDRVEDRYRIEKGNVQGNLQDRFNILYSSTETMRPSLYANTPKVEAKARHRDRKNPTVLAAIGIIETCTEYAMEETEFDDVMTNCVQDYTLPGWGVAWVRYEPEFVDRKGENGNPVIDAEGNPEQEIAYESVPVDYVSWKDFLCGPARTWKEVPWVAKRNFMYKKDVAKRFGAEIANGIEYNNNAEKGDAPVVDDQQACVWEIWHKPTRRVVWYTEAYPELLDQRDDPLRLKAFFPCPKPMRAISSTKNIIPRPFYSQYQSQAEELDRLTAKIRHLTQALNVRGVYDQSAEKIQSLLSGDGNKMVPIENWAQFIGQGGVAGAIQWVPIKDIVAVLMELYGARERAKAEIYEITGFSDIVRGSSKASETLGAQQIKQDWASARLRQMQKEVQRFARDIIRLQAEIICEHFSIESMALYAGFDVPPAPPPAPPMPGQMPQPDPAQQALMAFKQAVDLLKRERTRCANIGIETDSTILPDEDKERKDRMDFLGAAGAFMQQVGPLMQQSPEMREPLLAMMMFTIRTFRAARPLEKVFDDFKDKIMSAPPQDPNGGKDDSGAKAQAAMQVAQMKAQADSAKQDKEIAFRREELQSKERLEMQKAQIDLQAKQIDLQIKQAELAIKQAELEAKQQQAEQDRVLAEQDQIHRHTMDARAADHGEMMDMDGAYREDRRMDQEQQQNGLTNDEL